MSSIKNQQPKRGLVPMREMYISYTSDYKVNAMAINCILNMQSYPCQLHVEDIDNDIDDNIDAYDYDYDYDQMKKNKSDLHKDLIEYMYYPLRVAKYLETHGDIDEYLN